MTKILNGLNEIQLEAVQDVEGCILTLAGAGSGKTKCLTHRIAYMIDSGISPHNILAVTFTNKAANEMKERIIGLIGEQAKYIWVGTFHSICVRLINMFGEDIGISKNFTIIDDTEQDKVLKEIWTRIYEKPTKEELEGLASLLGNWKSNLVTPERALEENQPGQSKILHTKEANVYLEYQHTLQLNNSLDFDDLIMRAVHLISVSERAMSYVQNKFHYVLVDEYQDINKSQYELIKIISAKYKNLFVVGDDWQSIYGFRYADISNILNFQSDFNAKIYKLEQNYRSSTTILGAANAVIKNNGNQIEKTLWTDNETGEKIVFHVADNEYEEASMVSSVIQGMIDYKNKHPRDFAILYRTNMLSRVIEERLLSINIPCQVIGGTSFYERKEIKDMLAYMKVINNPNDSISLARVINVPKRGIGDTTVDKIRTYMTDNECCLFEVIQNIDKVPEKIAKKTINSINEFGAIIKDLIDFSNAPGRTSEEVIKAIWEATGYVRSLEESGTEEDLERVDNLEELLRIAREYDNTASEEESGLSNFLLNASLMSDLDSVPDLDVVKLMSVHAAKGLEFPYVFIIGMEEGIFPHGTAIAEGPAQVEEERRLFYVAITRAKERLYISMAIKRNLYYMDPDFIPRSKPSRFLSEIPKSLVIKV